MHAVSSCHCVQDRSTRGRWVSDALGEPLDRVKGDVPLSGIEDTSTPAASKSLSQQNTTPRAGIPPGCPERMPPNGRDIGQAGMGIKKKKKRQQNNKKNPLTFVSLACITAVVLCL